MIELFDTHAHLQEPEFDADRAAVIERAVAGGISTMVVPAVDLATAESAIALAERHKGLYATAGYHPHEAQRLTPQALDRIEVLLAHPKVVAVGEIGIDFYRDHSPRDVQVEAFEAQLALAEKHRMPVIIHCRDAWETLNPILQAWALRVGSNFDGAPLGVLHYFSSTLADACRYHELGFLISVHTSVTHPRAQELRDVIAALPLDALVIETDAPYGPPQSHRGKRNEPAYVIEAAQQVATLHGVSVEAVGAATTANAQRLFRIDDERSDGGRRDEALAPSAPEAPTGGPKGASLQGASLSRASAPVMPA